MSTVDPIALARIVSLLDFELLARQSMETAVYDDVAAARGTKSP